MELEKPNTHCPLSAFCTVDFLLDRYEQHCEKANKISVAFLEEILFKVTMLWCNRGDQTDHGAFCAFD